MMKSHGTVTAFAVDLLYRNLYATFAATPLPRSSRVPSSVRVSKRNHTSRLKLTVTVNTNR